ncbi:MAG TPA: DNA polymerase III subunit delta' [Alphaproteobacteria bacterium]|nr:DNA polymerase III subunit delta' [Alphaproteobacteria bacterium]
MSGAIVTPPLLPRANPELIGHADAEAVLLRSSLSGRMPHAWLIGGPSGIGKATLAYRFARFVLSGAATDAEGLFAGAPSNLHLDPEHPTFRRVRAAGHADLLTVERPWHKDEEKKDEADRRRRVGELPVDQVRKIAPFLHLTAAEGGWRVVVVDEAETMSRSAANAILKVLEEPPPRSLLLLVANNPGALLPTIRSRCRRLLLKPLPEADVIAYLERHAPDLGETDRLGIARLAEGSIGRAVALAQEGGLELYRMLYGLLDNLPRLDITEVHRLGDQLAPATAEQTYRTVVELLDWWLTRLIRSAAHGDMAPEVVAGEAALLQRLAGGRAALDRWLEVWEKTHRLFDRADSANLDRKQVVLQAFLSLEAAARA